MQKQENCLSVEGKSPVNRTHRLLLCSCDLVTFDPMISMYECDLKMLKMYLLTKNELSRPRLSKVRHYKQTHRHTRVKTLARAIFAGGNKQMCVDK